jgi:cathepsin H
MSSPKSFGVLPKMFFVLSWFFLSCQLLVATDISRTSNLRLDARFSRWQEKHGKFYEDPLEYEHRLDVFTRNAQRVTKHNEAHAEGFASYAMTLDTPFADVTDDEFRSTHLMESQNCSATTTTATSGETDFLTATKGDIPKSFDWRARGVITPIKDQKSCGSCWTFSTTGTLEAHTCIQSPGFDCSTWTGLAEQQLLDCAGGFNNFGCNGGLPSQAFEYIRYAGGIDLEASYDYKAKDGKQCLANPEFFGATVSQVYNISSGDEDDLVRAIGLVGPVSVAYDVSPDFRFYSHGVYDSFNATTNSTMCKSDPQSVNHAVVAVGYGETEGSDEIPSVPYYIVRNSWSTSWGMEGYFWIKRGENLCGISDCASFPIVPDYNGEIMTAGSKGISPLRRTAGVAS